MVDNADELLASFEVKPTPNRLLVLRLLLRAHSPMSLVEIETDLQTVDRSSILRVLSLFLERRMLHKIEDGRGIEKYEICHAGGEHHHTDGVDDSHPHFYCERCNRVYCLTDMNIPEVELPAAFKVNAVNFMLKGICPDCCDKE